MKYEIWNFSDSKNPGVSLGFFNLTVLDMEQQHNALCTDTKLSSVEVDIRQPKEWWLMQ